MRPYIIEKILVLKKKKEELLKYMGKEGETFILNQELICQIGEILNNIVEVLTSIYYILTMNWLGRLPKHSFENLEMLIKKGYISANYGDCYFRMIRLLNFYYDFTPLDGEDVYRIARDALPAIDNLIKEVEERI